MSAPLNNNLYKQKKGVSQHCFADFFTSSNLSGGVIISENEAFHISSYNLNITVDKNFWLLLNKKSYKLKPSLNNPLCYLEFEYQNSPFILLAIDQDLQIFISNKNHFNKGDLQRLKSSIIEYKQSKLSDNDQIKPSSEQSLPNEKGHQVSLDWLAMISHELRTPMNGILGFIDILKQSKLSSDDLEILDIIENSGESLIEILNDILDFSKLESGLFTLEKTYSKVPDLIHDILKLFKLKAQSKNITLEYTIDQNLRDNEVYIDKARLKQVLINLCSNALKFTSKGKIKIHCDYIDKKLDIKVSDTGRGIKQEQLEQIFSPYHQDELSDTLRGTGLGLSISKMLIEAMNGEIQVNSQVGVGTTFSLCIPSHLTKEQTSTKSSNYAQSLKNFTGKVLVVDDNSMNRKLMSTFLKSLQVDFQVCSSAHDAYRQICEEKYEVLFLDLAMPEMDGYQLHEKIRRHEKENQLKTMTIIAVTANAFKSEEKKCLEAGIQGFLRKPVKLSQICEELKKLN